MPLDPNRIEWDQKPRLSQFFNLRKESDKIIFSYTPHFSLRHGSIHPFQALAISLINGRLNWGQIVQALSVLTEQEPENALRFLSNVLKYVDPKNEIISENHSRIPKIFDPENFLLPPDRLNLESRLEAPITLILKITSRCKTDCIYCYAPRKRAEEERELSLDQYKEIFRQARDIGIFQINLCGGDGFVRKDFIDIIRTSVQMGFITDVSTKVDLKQDEIERLADTKLDYLQISIDSCVPEIADRMFGRKGHFERLVESIKRLKEAGIYVRTNSIITSLNVKTVEDTISMLADLGINNMKLTPAFESHHIDNTGYLLNPDEVNFLESLVERLQPKWAEKGVHLFYSRLKAPSEMDKKEKAEFWFRSRGICSGGRSAMFITPEGKVTLCEQVPHEPPFILGDLNIQTIRDVWNSRQVLDMAYPDRGGFSDSICSDCRDFKLCVEKRGHCFRDSWFANKTLFGPSPYCPHNHK
ncbi:MAG: radical SAM protein [bacterium]